MFNAPYALSVTRGQQFAGSYHQFDNIGKVAQASPHGLVALLFEGFFAALNRARGAMRSGEISAKGRAIGHAVRIVDEGLRGALNLSDGGTLAADLADLYAYICLRLTLANRQNNEGALDECVRLMTPLRDAWAGIAASTDHSNARN